MIQNQMLVDFGVEASARASGTSEFSDDSSRKTIISIFFSAQEGEFAFHFQRFFRTFFRVLCMMFEAFGMSGRVVSPRC
jgi:hypothetical protein